MGEKFALNSFSRITRNQKEIKKERGKEEKKKKEKKGKKSLDNFLSQTVFFAF